MNFIENYLLEVVEIIKLLDKEVIEKMIIELKKVQSNKGRLFIIGIGGSAANASHAVNDFRKLAGIESYAPTDNVSELSARTNDEGWSTVFDQYLRTSNLTEKDAILILSVGGGDQSLHVSENLCNAIDYAKSKNTKVLGIVGKTQGYTFKNADLCLAIPEVNVKHVTPHSESFQGIIWHLLVMHPKLQQNSTKW